MGLCCAATKSKTEEGGKLMGPHAHLGLGAGDNAIYPDGKTKRRPSDAQEWKIWDELSYQVSSAFCVPALWFS